AMRFVAYQDRKKVAAALKPIYTAPNEETARKALAEFEASELGRACQMVCVSRTERNGKNHDHDRREEPRRALGPGPGRAAESLRAA
ncbi:hypothetical protein GR250_37820, partial [Rhizobium leguminosarum]|nr:hypothetical protein [Rhizobium leguminosarum]